jgi:hypothetical protein
MKRVLVLCAFLAAVAISISAGGNVVESLPLHLKLAGLKAAKGPELFEDYLVLSAVGPFRFVGAVFEHEGFIRIHAFERNSQGVFVLAYPIPLKRSSPLAYRLVIDGVWTADPSNPRRRSDRPTGLELSVVDVPNLSDLRLGRREILAEDGRTAHFLYRAEPGETVSVCGSFDNWDPFIHEMAETSPGTYELELPLPPGTNYYAFVHRGETKPDPLNVAKASRPEGQVVSVVVVKPRF